ncbi:MAG: TonB-dependent receptor domain-containing protein [Bacteroidales bacterium]
MKSIDIFRVAFTLIILVICSTVIAQPTGLTEKMKHGIVRGTVVDKASGQMIEYSTVRIFKSTDSSLVSGSITGSDGNFEVVGLPYGQFYMEVSMMGFATKNDISFRIKTDNTRVELGSIALTGENMLSEVEVVAQKRQVEYRIDKKVVNVGGDLNAIGGTAVDALENVPSINIDLEGNVTVRGSSNFQVLINGKPSVLTGTEALEQIPASSIENIEIITNPSVKYNPEGTGGILNIILKKRAMEGVSGVVNVSAETNDKYHLDATLSMKRERATYTLSANYRDAKYLGNRSSSRYQWMDGDTTYRIENGNGGFNRKSYGLSLGGEWNILPNSTFGVQGELGQWGGGRNNESNKHVYSSNNTEDVYSRLVSSSNRKHNYFRSQLNFNHDFGGDVDHNIQSYLQVSNRKGESPEESNEYNSDATFSRIYDYLSRSKSSESEKDFGLNFKTDYTKKFGDRLIFETGIEMIYDKSNEDFTLQFYDTVANSWDGTNALNQEGTLDYERLISALYASVSGQLGSFGYMLGVRGEHTYRDVGTTVSGQESNIWKNLELYPSLHTSYKFLEKNQVSMSYSRRVSRPRGRDLDPFPTYEDLTTIFRGDPNLNPEYSNSLEFNYMRNFSGNSYVSAELFYRNTDDKITRFTSILDDGTFLNTVRNANSDYSVGGEVMANFNVFKWLLVNMSYSLYDYGITTTSESTGEKSTRTSLTQNARLNLTANVFKNGKLQLSSMYRGPSASAQGDRGAFFFSNVAYKHSIIPNTLDVTAKLTDMLGTMNFKGTSFGDNFHSDFEFKRESQVVGLSLSYKFNNYKEDRGKRSNGSLDSGDGMDDMNVM